jgi:hypothetical protein
MTSKRKGRKVSRVESLRGAVDELFGVALRLDAVTAKLEMPVRLRGIAVDKKPRRTKKKS